MSSRELTAAAVNRIRTPAGIIGMIVLMMLGAACSGNDEITVDDGNDEITVDDLIGIWLVKPEGSYVQFNTDGTYSIAFTVEGLDDEIAVEEGQYTLEGTLFTFISSDESGSCAAGQRGFYEMERTEEDGWRMVIQEDECGIRGSTGTVILARVP